MSLYEFGSDASGLRFQIEALDDGEGGTNFTVTVFTGSLNLNALYWNDGVDDNTQFDLGTKKDNSLNMNGSGEDWDGGVKLSNTGLGQGDGSTYLSANGNADYSFTMANLDLSQIETLGVRATSTSTAEGSIKWVADETCVPHVGENIFTENFDFYPETQQYFDPPGTFVFGTTDLTAANGWTNASYVELGANGYGNIASTSGDAWLDTQNSPGPIDISHTFKDANGGQAQLSFDIGTQSLDYLGQHYATNPDAAFEFRIDGATVASFTAADFAQPNVMEHHEVVFDTGAPGTDHTLELVDVTGVAGQFTGFSIDSVQINDWLVC